MADWPTALPLSAPVTRDSRGTHSKKGVAGVAPRAATCSGPEQRSQRGARERPSRPTTPPPPTTTTRKTRRRGRGFESSGVAVFRHGHRLAGLAGLAPPNHRLVSVTALRPARGKRRPANPAPRHGDPGGGSRARPVPRWPCRAAGGRKSYVTRGKPRALPCHELPGSTPAPSAPPLPPSPPPWRLVLRARAVTERPMPHLTSRM